jgi:hypothetical protein
MEMKISKKQMIIAAIVIGAIAVWYFFIRKKKIESSYGPNFGSYGFYGNESSFASIGQICSKDRPCGNGLRCSGRRCVPIGQTNTTTGGGATMGGGAGGPRPNTSTTATVADSAIPIPVKPMTASATAMVDPNATLNVSRIASPAVSAKQALHYSTYGTSGGI